MKNITASILCLLVLLGGYGCQESESERLSRLEAEVKALRAKSKAREEAFKEELVQVRKNLEGIKVVLEMDEGRAQVQEGTGKGLDEKTKSFVTENLDRLLNLTRKLLDTMEKELDEQLGDMNEPAPPQGDAI